LIALAAACAALQARGSEVEGLDDSLRLDQLQYIGTHNSYHIAPGDAIATLMLSSGYTIAEEWPARRLVEATDYSHPAISTQLKMGMRLFELDVHDDPEGGRFSDPAFLRLVMKAADRLPYGNGGMGDLRKPGFKVFHQPDWDFRSTNYLLTGCLQEIETWSNAHPGHLPIIIQIEAKDAESATVIGGQAGVTSRSFEADTWRRLEAAIKAVIPAKKIVTPDLIRGDRHSLREALAAKGWPTLAELKGKYLFLLLNKKDLTESYLRLDPLLHDRLFFVSLTPNHPSASWFRTPEPSFERLPYLIADGFLASTMVDQHTLAARKDDPTNRERAFRSGAQFLSTDFPVPDRRFSDYQVCFADGAYVRPNPMRLRK